MLVEFLFLKLLDMSSQALGVPLDAARLRCWGAASLRNLVAKAVELRDVGTRCLVAWHGKS